MLSGKWGRKQISLGPGTARGPEERRERDHGGVDGASGGLRGGGGVASVQGVVTPLLFTLVVVACSFFAGLLGSLVGVGGGIIVVPLLSLFLGVDIHHAIAASIISVIATSCGAASSYVRSHVSNLRLGMLLEIATAAGALSGAFLAVVIASRWLFVLFGAVLVYTAFSMGRKPQARTAPLPTDALADRLKLHGAFFDPATKSEVVYRVARTKVGFAISYVAGIVSGLLGVGGGVIKVPVMNLAMGLPLKACTATSNFMIGVTAAASAAVYFTRGEVQPFIAAPVAVGVLLGAQSGAKVMGHLKSDWIRLIFVAVLVVSAVQMFLRGFR
jgi:uncharacterized membrane protein YfcA